MKRKLLFLAFSNSIGVYFISRIGRIEDDYTFNYNKNYKVDDEEEDLLGWLDGLVEEEKVGYGSF